MTEFLTHVLLNSVLLLVIADLIKGITVTNWSRSLLTALVLGLLNATIKPILLFLTFPITILTLGLSILVLNALLLWLASSFTRGFKIEGFIPALLASVLLSVSNTLIFWIF